MRSRSTNAWRSIIALSLATVAPLLACGPFFPSSVLEHPQNTLYAAPVAMFGREIDLLQIPRPVGLVALPPSAHTDVFGQSALVDLAELETVLRQNAVEATVRVRVLSQYDRVRSAIRQHAIDRARWQESNLYLPDTGPRNPPPPGLTNIVMPSGLPPEFESYLRGLLAYHADRTNEACALWRALLSLPVEQRRHRSTWAAFMLGKAMLDTDRPAACAWFRQTRQLRADGFADALGLAPASLGWEALAELRLGNYERAVDLYLQQEAAGDGSALLSLHTTARIALRANPTVLRRIAQHPDTRRVLTAYLVSRDQPSPESARRWLASLETAGAQDLENADHLAWLAYQAGDYLLARRWLACARKDSPMRQWIGAKLLLRAGKLDEASAKLAAMVSQFPKNEEWRDVYKHGDVGEEWNDQEGRRASLPQINGERAALHMTRGCYAEALDLLLQNGYGCDAAYVAERVLSLDELKAYVDQNWPLSARKAAGLIVWNGKRDKSDPGGAIRWLLGRRLARLNRLAEASVYFPDDIRVSFDTYATALRMGRDRAQRPATRATALAAAARLVRFQGMELLGTACEPDWQIVEGEYDLLNYMPITSNRTFLASEQPFVTKDEQRRNQLPEAEPNRRFHYRYTACDLAWEAAELMPDESAATASFLCEAGRWIKSSDVAIANRFYQALVKRCGKTELGRAAIATHWFPPAAKTPVAGAVSTPPG